MCVNGCKSGNETTQFLLVLVFRWIFHNWEHSQYRQTGLSLAWLSGCIETSFKRVFQSAGETENELNEVPVFVRT